MPAGDKGGIYSLSPFLLFPDHPLLVPDFRPPQYVSYRIFYRHNFKIHAGAADRHTMKGLIF